VTLLGYVGADPEARRFGERQVVNFSLATSESWKDKQTQEWKESTQWHRVSAWTPTAEIVLKHVAKGCRVLVKGKVKYSKWKGQDGAERTSTEIEIRELIVLEKAKTEAPAAVAAPKKKESFEDFPEALDGEDDDLPF
jgi:single-strand DNA-binding protein